MGVVKRTHRQSREMQQRRKHFRKHPEDALLYLSDIQKCIESVIESLAPVIKSLIEAVVPMINKINQTIAERGPEVISPEDLSAFPYLEDLKDIGEDKEYQEESK